VLWHRVLGQIIAEVLEEPVASIFRFTMSCCLYFQATLKIGAG
jgi:hypothetical protein